MKLHKPSIILSFLFFITLQNALAQSFDTFKNFSLENPLSYKSINTIAQDKNGFMWFGSQVGLHRFDGYELKTFLHDTNDVGSISDDVISQVFIDSKDSLWVATRGGGLNLYHSSLAKFERINQNAGLSNDNVNVIYEDKNGQIWVGTEKGLNILSKKDEVWRIKQIVKESDNLHSLKSNTIQSVVQVTKNEVWVGSLGGGVSIFSATGNFLRHLDFSQLSSKKDFASLVNSIYQDKQGNIWIGTINNGLIKIERDSRRMSQFLDSTSQSITSNTIESIFQDSQENIWVATDHGLSIFINELQSFIQVKHAPNNLTSLASNFVLTVFEDKNKMIWVGTFSGISRWDPYMATFQKYVENGRGELDSKLIMSFSKGDKNELFVASYDGVIYSLDLKVNQLKVAADAKALGNVRITTLLAEGDIFWVGTRASGLFRYNRATGALTSYSHNVNDDSSISANSITDIFRDSSGTLWVSTYHNGLNKLINENTFSRFVKNDKANGSSPNSNHIIQILEDSSGYLWLATYGGGINRFSIKNNTFKYYKRDNNNPSSISSDFSWIMHFDAEENLWIGSQAGGISILSAQNIANGNDEFTHLNVANGMKDQTVYGFEHDHVGNIWFSTNNGITRYSPKSKIFKHFDSRHGLTDLEFNHGAILKADDESIYFGSAKGFTSINPAEILHDQPAPKVWLTNILKLNEPMKFDTDLAQVKEVSFDHNDRLISFAYVGLNFSDPNATHYKYRLLGFDKEWVNAGKSRRATYTNLPAGEYVLQIIAANNDNNWSEPGHSLKIIVKPAPWNTWWAYIIYVLLIALLVLSYSKRVNRKLVIEQKQKKQLKEQIIEKTKKYTQKNIELERANNKLEKSAIVDKATGLKSRRYLDIYIEQTSQLMTQIHHNIQPTQRSLLPRLYVLMIQIDDVKKVTSGQVVNLAELMLYTRNVDDLVVRWSENTFAIIGYEKENSAAELAARLTSRLTNVFEQETKINVAYTFFPFDIEQPKNLNWDQCNVLIELVLSIVSKSDNVNWIGIKGPKLESFNFLDVIQMQNIEEIEQHLYLQYQ